MHTTNAYAYKSLTQENNNKNRLRDIDLLLENREIFMPHLYLAPRRGWPRRNSVKMFYAGKTRMIDKKNYDDMLSRFHLIPKRNRRTDRQTYGQICYINIARQYADAR